VLGLMAVVLAGLRPHGLGVGPCGEDVRHGHIAAKHQAVEAAAQPVRIHLQGKGGGGSMGCGCSAESAGA
jgi:hypothetical protein